MRYIYLNLLPVIILLFIISGFLAGVLLFRLKKLSIWLRTSLSVLVIFISLLTLNALWIERNLIQINYHILTNSLIEKRVAVLSDIHAGVWKSQTFVNSVVTSLKQIPNLDLVLIPGDWTYYPKPDQLKDIFSPFKSLSIPIYGVLGNHDLEKPGDPIRTQLSEALKVNNINLIDNQIVDLDKIKLIGIGDSWAGEDDTQILNQLVTNEPVIIVAHNPDSTRKYPEEFISRITYSNLEVLTVSGHTHCGQIRIPFLYNRVLPVIDNYYDKGFYRQNHNNSVFQPIESTNRIPAAGNNLFITCGVGEVGLPLRLFNPATIDVLDFE
jgi:uncharacterized protein